jgi:hypothetical protein
VQDIYVQRAGDSYPAHWLYMSCNQIIVALQTGEEDTIFIFLFLFLLLSLKLSIFEAAFPYLNTSTSLLIE